MKVDKMNVVLKAGRHLLFIPVLHYKPYKWRATRMFPAWSALRLHFVLRRNS